MVDPRYRCKMTATQCAGKIRHVHYSSDGSIVVIDLLRGLAAAAAAGLILATPAWPGGDEAPGVAGLVRARVAEAVGRPVEVVLGPEHVAGGWTLVCGDPVEPSGAAFDISRSRLAGSEFGARFCALLQDAPAGPTIVEFDIGSNDMPAVGWIDRHGLPPDLLSR